MIDLHDAFGLAGVALSIYAYARIQWRRDYVKELSYSVINTAGSLLMMVSLMHRWNLPSFVSNVVWLLISVYGVYRCMKYVLRDRRALKKQADAAGPHD